MDATNSHKTLVIACGALAKEIVAIRTQLGLSAENLTLQCLPADYHNTPAKIAPAVEKILSARRQDFDTVLIGYGECGTGGALDTVLTKYKATRIAGAHCYEFFAGADIFAEIVEEEIGSFFLTDYLVKNFDRLIIKGLGLDKYPDLRDTYFGNYRQVVYMVQERDPALLKLAEEAAHQLGLALKVVETGYGDLRSALEATTPQTQETAHV